MGNELARAALRRGYRVTLISGPTDLVSPKGANFIQVEDAREMDREVKKNFKDCDCLFMTSAVCDWRPKKTVRGKIKKGSLKRISLELVQNPDILGGIGKDKDGKVLVGFALESNRLIENAKAKLKKKHLDLIVANRIEKNKNPFGAGKADVAIIDRTGKVEKISNITKKEIAERLLNKTERLWEERG